MRDGEVPAAACAEPPAQSPVSHPSQEEGQKEHGWPEGRPREEGTFSESQATITRW